MNRIRSTALAVIAAASWIAVDCPTGFAQQNQGNQSQAAESRGSGPFRGGFLRRLRDDLRSEEEERAAKEKEKAAANRENREPTPARRPSSGQQPGQTDGRNSVDRPVPGAGRLPGTNAPGFHLSDAGVLPLPGSPHRAPEDRAPEEAADRLPTPPPKGFGLVLVDRDEKLFVQTIEPDGNAAECGLRRGDQVLQLGGIDIHSIAEFDEITGIMKAGDQIDLVFSRDGEKSTAQLQFGSSPPLGEETEGPPLVADTDPDSPAPDFVPEPASQRLPSLDSELAAPALTGNGSSVLQEQQQLAPGNGVAHLQQTVLQQQQIIRQLQQDVENLRRQLQAGQRPQANSAPRTNQSTRRRN